jgi:hypothetical protein
MNAFLNPQNASVETPFINPETTSSNPQGQRVGPHDVTRLHNLAELRRLRNMTQVEVARIMGNTQPSVSAAERAPEVSFVHVQRYARALGLEMEVTFYADGKAVKTWRK